MTNWYIRFNRRRLTGELGVEDTKRALNTLFEILYTLVRGLAPFTPFITDNIYQKLLVCIPESLRGEDPRSVHFLSFPEVREELFDEVVERQVSRMKRVIELGRVSRFTQTSHIWRTSNCWRTIFAKSSISMSLSFHLMKTSTTCSTVSRPIGPP